MLRIAHRMGFIAGMVLAGVLAWGQAKDGEKPADVKALHATPVVPPKAPAVAAKPLDLSQPDWRFAHPKPDLLASISVGTIMRSPLVVEALNQLFAGPGGADRAKIEPVLKMVSTIERVQVSARATPGKNDPDVLILVTGNLDAIVRQMLTQQSKDNTMVSREVAPNAILFGKATVIDLAARRMSGISAPPTGDLSGNDLWIAGDVGLFNMGSKGAITGVPPGLDALKHFSLGMNLRDPVELSVNLSMMNEDGAQKMMALYTLASAQAAQTPDAAVLASATKVERQGTEIRFRFSAPSTMLQSQMKSAGSDPARLAGLMGMLGMAAPGAQRPAPKPSGQTAPPENSGKIMIYGLDDGPREVGAKKQ
jgi:hypothetical protein